MMYARLRRCPADLRPQAHPAEFEGETTFAVVVAMARQVHRAVHSRCHGDDPDCYNCLAQDYMAGMARRTETMCGTPIRADYSTHFLADLVQVGVLHLWSPPTKQGDSA